MQILWQQSSPRQCLAYGKKCTEYNKISHFGAVCRSRSNRAMNEMEQQATQESAEENSIDWVNTNSIHFNKNCSVITVKLKMSAGIINVIVPYKVDTGSDGYIMQLPIYKELFPRITSEKFAVTQNGSVQLKSITKQQ